MSFLGVSVDMTTKSSQVSCSGLKICDRFVLTHGTLVWSLVEDYIKNIKTLNDKALCTLESDLAQCIIKSNPKFTIVLPTPGSHFTSGSESNSCDVIETEGYLEHIFVPPFLVSDFSHLLSTPRGTWEFKKKWSQIEQSKAEALRQKHFEDIYLSTFVILKMKGGGGGDSLHDCLRLMDEVISNPKKGSTVFIDGCPFGAAGSRSVFLNSLSKGIVSNVAGNVFITDARCILGCEGAPVHSSTQSQLGGVCGVVVSPFCWREGQWVGLTFAAAWRPLRQYLLQESLRRCDYLSPLDTCYALECAVPRIRGGETEEQERAIAAAVCAAERSVVRVSCSPSFADWGSGVVVGGGRVVLTCAHVTGGARDKVAYVMLWNGERKRGRVLFQTRPRVEGGVAPPKGEEFDLWDLALIGLEDGGGGEAPPSWLPLAQKLPPIGSPVLVSGYPLFDAGALRGPSVCLGNLARVCCLPSRSFQWGPGGASLQGDSVPVLLQSTCSVYGGVSGGPLVSIHPDEGPLVIGVVSCCARDAATDLRFPHVSLAAPAPLVAAALREYLLQEDGDVSALSVLRVKSREGLSLWDIAEKERGAPLSSKL